MKCLVNILIALLFLASACRKNNIYSNDKSNAVLLGKWVEKTYRLDTLVVYQENGKTIMFDNSFELRLSGRMWPADEFYRRQVMLRRDSIGFKTKNAPRSEPFFYYPFKWIKYEEEFRMSYNGLRPYLSSIGSFTYERVK